MDDLFTALKTAIIDFVERDERNAMAAHGGMRMYDKPLVGAAAADDDWFARFTEPGIIGPCHLPPHDWLPEAQSVVCWFLPFTRVVRDTNRAPGLPSEEWTSARNRRRSVQQPSAGIRHRLAEKPRRYGAGASAEQRFFCRQPRLQLVGAARRLCSRPRHVRPAPRAHHAEGHGRAAGQRHHLGEA